jgi:hypothetical protein
MELSGTEDVDVVLERIQRGATGRKHEYFKYNGVKVWDPECVSRMRQSICIGRRLKLHMGVQQ